ncbi:MAG: DUF3109 family protein [Bacteroidales bacterium]
MIIDNLIIDNELFNTYFACNLDKCHGICCVEGVAGAPLENQEIDWLQNNVNNFHKYLDKKGKEAIEKIGVYEIDLQGDLVTPLKAKGECAYLIWENGCAKCVFQKLYNEGKLNFYKPISCHLYPIRVYKLVGFYHLTLHKWYTCTAAFEHGKHEKIPVLLFLKDALRRKFPNQVEKMLEKTNY